MTIRKARVERTAVEGEVADHEGVAAGQARKHAVRENEQVAVDCLAHAKGGPGVGRPGPDLDRGRIHHQTKGCGFGRALNPETAQRGRIADASDPNYTRPERELIIERTTRP